MDSKDDSMENQEEDQGGTMQVQEDVQGNKVICDGLLCSILHAMSHFANKEEFVSVIERECGELEIIEARRKLFTYFSDVTCDKQKKPVLDITRGSVKKNIEDIVEQILKVDKTVKSQIFFMPWDYVMKPFSSDTEIRADFIEKELGAEIDIKIDSLKQEMVVKNQAIIELIHSKFNEVIQQVSISNKGQLAPTYASVAGVGQQGGGAVHGGVIPTFSLTQPAAAPPGNMPEQVHRRDMARGCHGGPGNHGGVEQPEQHGQQGVGFGRSRSGSANKRRRGDNGPIEDYNYKERSASNSRQKKFVVGTSTGQTGRKMRAPPADIFVYGVHPDTTKEEIVEDLAYSDISINTNDIIQKSKEEAFLKSYKISVKAEDLQKALDPSVWPLRVKVREFIHYSRKTPANHQRNAHAHNAAGAGEAHGQHQAQSRVDGQQGGDLRGQPSHFLAPNRYALPGDGTPGGNMQMV